MCGCVSTHKMYVWLYMYMNFEDSVQKGQYLLRYKFPKGLVPYLLLGMLLIIFSLALNCDYHTIDCFVEHW